MGPQAGHFCIDSDLQLVDNLPPCEIREIPRLRVGLSFARFSELRMACHKCLRFVWLLAASCFALPGAAADRNSSTQDGSLIFPSVTSQWRSSNTSMPFDVVRPATYEQVIAPPATSGSPPLSRPGDVPGSSEGEIGVPGGEPPLFHPIQDVCGACLRPGRRLLSALRYGRSGGPAVASEREPWIYRPFSVGIFFGPIVGSPLIDDWVEQQTGTFAGARFGWDLDDDWGVEMRLASATIPLVDSELQITMQQQYDTDRGLPLDSPYRLRWEGTRLADHFLWDVSMLWYPWGDANLRPYLLFGIGISRIEFDDRLDVSYSHVLVGMPVGIGCKHRWADWLAFRVECLDNMAYAGNSAFEMQHNFSITGGFEVRFGRPRVFYWPWDPGMQK